ncbi:BTB/POZ domain-containing protein At5g03250-like [Magnolia sinica]|uniref:BTB/POZ domain-containing protein At5g03250-like n=1 Tax=Magnolia sinica TaxID=86752 RepID=UPI002658325D|nr:BTB/POZ domain-containing protein At5g03250-like [Magnolia sinica]
MASMKLGSKPELFSRDGQTWICTTGLQSDVVVEVGDMSFRLHKFPLLSRSQILEKMIRDICGKDGTSCVLQLHDIPGGIRSFELVVKFCYGVKLEVTALNVVSLRCAAEHLQMTEDYGEGNLISQTENFLVEVLQSWKDTIKALETCEDLLPHAEELHVVSRCIESLAMKVCADPYLFDRSTSGLSSMRNSNGGILWNGISTGAKPRSVSEDWWYKDVSFLSLNMYKRLILAMESRCMKPEMIVGSLVFNTKRYLPGLSRHSSFRKNTGQGVHVASVSVASVTEQRALIEVIVDLLPKKKGVASTKFLLGLLRTAMILHMNPSCRENLEKRVAEQLDKAALEDILIPNLGYSVETLYDIDCVQRILDHFMSADQSAVGSSPCIVDEGPLIESPSLTPMTSVAQLMDGYLAEVAPDINLKFQKFQSLAAMVPDYARPLDDGIYRAIDIYLKAHPWLTDSEKEQLCQLMNCEKLSLEACTHAAQNERLPLRVIVQVLFFEQLRLRTSIASWFFVSDNIDDSQAPHGNLVLSKDDDPAPVEPTKENLSVGIDNMKLRVSDLEEECLSMRQEIEKLGKKNSWNIFSRKCGLKQKSRCNAKAADDGQNHKKQ